MDVPIADPPIHVLDVPELDDEAAWNIMCEAEYNDTHRSTGTAGKREDGNVLQWIKSAEATATEESPKS